MTNKKILITPKTQSLNHMLTWPEIPEKAPQSHAHRLSERRDFWYRQALALNLVATGFSLVCEIRYLLAEHLQINENAGSLKRALMSLIENGILHSLTLELPLKARLPLSVVRLTRRGRGLCNELRWNVDQRWQPQESEWERMRRVHEKGKKEPTHTLAVQAFAYQARLRGWSAGVMPQIVDGNRFAPDAVIAKHEKSMFVEVELDYGKKPKWRNMGEYQGSVNLCAKTRQHCRALISECQSVGFGGLGADLSSLFRSSKDFHPSTLWLEEW